MWFAVVLRMLNCRSSKNADVPYGPPFGTSLFRLRTERLYLVAYIVATSGTACERGLAEVRRARALGT
jgi:hypothetical protein